MSSSSSDSAIEEVLIAVCTLQRFVQLWTTSLAPPSLVTKLVESASIGNDEENFTGTSVKWFILISTKQCKL
jgi:hypothetical protein